MIPVWSTACPDWAERLKKGLSIIPAPIYPDQLHMHWRFLNNCELWMHRVARHSGVLCTVGV